MYFTYWNNSKSWHGELMAVIKANSISEADKLFKEQTNFDPIKCSWIGCSLT